MMQFIVELIIHPKNGESKSLHEQKLVYKIG